MPAPLLRQGCTQMKTLPAPSSVFNYSHQTKQTGSPVGASKGILENPNGVVTGGTWDLSTSYPDC